jgi:catechol 2,3-dioxygenase-like lactoylglutathione lyase family enzyme
MNMSVVELDHVTIRTANLAATLGFYENFFCLRPGFRPPFSIGGAWLYADGGDYPILHVIETEVSQPGMRDHVAFRVSGLPEYLNKVKAEGSAYMAVPVPETDLVQVQHRDPNGLLVEATFHGETIHPDEIRDSKVP